MCACICTGAGIHAANLRSSVKEKRRVGRLLSSLSLHDSSGSNPSDRTSISTADADIVDNQDSNRRDLVLMDVTPLSLGIETSNGGMSVVIRRYCLQH